MPRMMKARVLKRRARTIRINSSRSSNQVLHSGFAFLWIENSVDAFSGSTFLQLQILFSRILCCVTDLYADVNSVCRRGKCFRCSRRESSYSTTLLTLKTPPPSRSSLMTGPLTSLSTPRIISASLPFSGTPVASSAAKDAGATDMKLIFIPSLPRIPPTTPILPGLS